MQTKQKIFNFIILTSYTLYNLHVKIYILCTFITVFGSFKAYL